MTIRRVDETVLLDGVCAVEEAETLMHEIQAGATVIDWTGCAHLHTACLQVLLAAGLPTRGTPANPALARWLPGLVRSTPDVPGTNPATAFAKA
jgi:hypothetical protein